MLFTANHFFAFRQEKYHLAGPSPVYMFEEHFTTDKRSCSVLKQNPDKGPGSFINKQ